MKRPDITPHVEKDALQRGYSGRAVAVNKHCRREWFTHAGPAAASIIFSSAPAGICLHQGETL